MAPTIAGDIVRVAARHLFNGTDEQVNVFYFQVNSDPVTPEDELILEDLGQHLSNAYIEIEDQVAVNVVPADLQVYNVSQDYPLGTTTWGPGYTGGQTVGDTMPPGTCLLVLHRTNVKHVVGKTYLPTMAENRQSAGVWDATALAAAASWVTEIRDTAIRAHGYSFRLRVWSRLDEIQRTIVTSTPMAHVAYQRRRKQGRGS